MNVERLDLALTDLATAIDYPPTPNLATVVRARIESSEASEPARLFPRPRWHRVAFAVAALVLAFAATLTFSPAARRAVADLLGVAGIHIDLEGETPGSGPIRTGINAGDLGERVYLGAAQNYVDFDMRTPLRFDSAPEVFLDRSVPGGRVSFYVTLDGNKALVTQFVADLEESFFKKVDATGGSVEFPNVNGIPGYWVGGTHVIYYVTDGEFLEDSLRQAGPALLWEEGGVTYRIEGAGSLDRALALAATLR
jgi:hypothetical protein